MFPITHPSSFLNFHKMAKTKNLLFPSVIARKTKNLLFPSCIPVETGIHRKFISWIPAFAGMLTLIIFSAPAFAATGVPLTVTLSEPVNVTGCPANCPRLTLDVGGVTRYADYSAGSGTSNLTFTYATQAGDLDLDGITISSNAIDLNTSGTVKDLNGNNLSPLTFTIPNTSNVKINHPSLSMDFVGSDYILNGTHYATLPSFLSAASGTFTRASVGTYFDSSGVMQTAASGTPRFDHDPVTHTAKGILIEEQRTNLLTRSSEIDNATWGKNGISVNANTLTSPDATMTADYVVADGTAYTYITTSTPTFTAGTTLTRSIFAKAGTSGKVIFEHHDGGTWGHTDYNLLTQTIAPASGVTASMVAVGNGWYRLFWTLTFTNSSTTSGTGTIYIDSYASGGAGKGVYLWGAQLEQGSFATSYIPTAGATATRDSEQLTIPTSTWFNSTEGTLSASGYSSANGTGSHLLLGLGNGAGDGVYFRQDSSGALYYMGREPSMAIFDGATVPASLNVLNKVSGNYADGNIRSFSVNGGLISANTFGVGYGSSYSKIGIGKYPNAIATDGQWNGTIKDAKYYPAEALGSQLQLLTQ